MFGQVAGFVNGQMTGGTFGSQVNLRLSEADVAEFVTQYQARIFEPMEGRPMKEYVVVPASLRADPELMATWFERSVGYTAGLPPKKKK
jgi:TfoX/Sxy family transcriptional regulator of competence genes